MNSFLLRTKLGSNSVNLGLWQRWCLVLAVGRQSFALARQALPWYCTDAPTTFGLDDRGRVLLSVSSRQVPAPPGQRWDLSLWDVYCQAARSGKAGGNDGPQVGCRTAGPAVGASRRSRQARGAAVRGLSAAREHLANHRLLVSLRRGIRHLPTRVIQRIDGRVSGELFPDRRDS